MKKTVSALLALTIALILCSCSAAGKGDASTTAAAGTVTIPDTSFVKDSGDMFSERDLDSDPDVSDAVTVSLSGKSAEASSDTVKITDGSVTVSAEGTYVFSGSFLGTVAVDAPESAKITLVLSGASITAEDCAALYILEADKVFVNLAEGTENALSVTGSFSDTDSSVDGALFSRGDLTLNGTGSLSVICAEGHGIVAKDDLVITGGTYSIDSALHAIDANDSIRVSGGALTAVSGKDGLHAENSDDAEKGFVYISDGTFSITSDGDCLSASSTLQIEGGTFSLTAGGGSVNGEDKTDDMGGMGGMGGPGGHGGGMGGPGGRPYSYTAVTTDTATDDSVSTKGIKSEGSMLISGGTFTVDSADDSIHSNTDITISGGNYNIKSGDDGIHADGTLAITDGNISISESYEGLEALHIGLGGGTVTLCATDDGLNAAGGNDDSGFGGMYGNDRFAPGGTSSGSGSITVSGGSLYINASGDGIDANGTFEMSGGTVTVCGPTVGDTATLDYDVSAVISGGTFIGTGASGMAQTFSDSTQGVIALNVGTQVAGTDLSVTDSDGKILLSHSPELSYSVVILSCSDMVKGESYTVTVGSLSESFEAS